MHAPCLRFIKNMLLRLIVFIGFSSMLILEKALSSELLVTEVVLNNSFDVWKLLKKIICSYHIDLVIEAIEQ